MGFKKKEKTFFEKKKKIWSKRAPQQNTPKKIFDKTWKRF